MLSNRLAFAALAVACIGAAAGGDISRRVRMTLPARHEHSCAEPRRVDPPRAVQETEAVVDETAPPPASPVLAPATKASSLDAQTRRSRRSHGRLSPSTAAPSVGPATPGAKAVRPAADARSHVAERRRRTTRLRLPPGVGSAASHRPSSAETPAPAPKPEDRAAQEPPRAPEPPQKTFEELVVPADSVIGLQAETSVTSERARIEDRVEARVTRDVRVHDTVAIPAGARALGSVVSVERGGKFKERARLGIRFNMLVLADGSRVPISTETIYRDGDPPGKESAAKIGGAAVGGAILGAIFGGGKGAAIGATAGAGAGSATVAASERNTASLARRRADYGPHPVAGLGHDRTEIVGSGPTGPDINADRLIRRP